MTEKLIPVVVYGVKSSPDEKESVADQHRQVLAAVEREGGRHIVAEPFGEANASGYRGERGPQLEAAMRAATEAADEHGEAELWVWHSSRLARGDGRKGNRSVNLIVAQLLYENVTVRSVADPAFVTPMLAGIAGEQAHKYSADLSAHVKRGKRQQLERGDHLGGPPCDGYQTVRQHDGDGRVVGRTFRLDPGRAPLVLSIFYLSAQGIPDAAIARRINAEGHRTRRGRPFDRRAIQNTLTNPWYAGRIATKLGTPDEQIVDGKHPPLIDPAEFDRIQAARVQRDLGSGAPTIGRPAQNHALAKLARCVCGERMISMTSNFRRKDGSRRRTYLCHAVHANTGTCDAKPINAEVVDAAVIAGLDTLLVDFDGWRRRIEDGHSAERDRLASEVDRAQRDHDAQADKTMKMEAKWGEYVAEGDDDKADIVFPMIDRQRQTLVASERRLQAAQDALSSVPTEAPADAMLDFANALQAAISGQVDTAGTMAEVNQALRELFSEFRIEARDEVKLAALIDRLREDKQVIDMASYGVEPADVLAGREDPVAVAALPADLKRTVIRIQPFLREDTAARLVAGATTMSLSAAPGEPPPLRWLQPDPEENSHSSSERRVFGS